MLIHIHTYSSARAHTPKNHTHQRQKGGGSKSDEHAEVTDAACKPFENASVPNRKKRRDKKIKKKLEHGEVADAVINHKA